MSMKHLTRREFLRGAAAAGIGLVAAACAPAAAPATTPSAAPGAAAAVTPAPKPPETPRAGGTLRIAINADATTLGHPPDPKTITDFLVMAPVIESLGRYDATGKMTPWLAESFTEDAAAKTITIKLKQGIKFHDGTDFNAEACRWNLDAFLKAGRAELRGVMAIAKVDDYTVKVTLSQWNNTIMHGIGYFAGPMISPTAFQKNGGKDWAVKNPVGTGPFQFVSWERDVALKYKKFDGYWQKGKPYLDAIEFRIIKDPVTTVAAVKAKDVDAYMLMPAQAAKELQASGLVVKKLETGLGASLAGIISDSANAKSPFADAKVRQAMSYAIDAKTIVETQLYGFGVLTNQWAAPGAWSYNPDVKGFPYNPDKAKQLLAEAGHANGFKIKMQSGNAPETVQIFTAIQGYLAKVGIDAQLEPIDNARYVQLTSQAGWEGLINFSTRADADSALVMPRVFSATGVLFTKSITHPEKLEKLLVDITVAPDFETKRKLALELQKVAFDELAMFTPLYVTTLPVAKQATVRGDGINATHGSVWTPEETWLAQGA
jgi:ABC-type transport system substrate-binding protein